MDETYYPGESPEDQVQANGLTFEEMQEIAYRVHSKAEYLERTTDVEHMENIWKFVRWCVENNKGYFEFDA